MVPEPDVLDGGPVVEDVLVAELELAGELALGDVREAEGVARGLDVVGDVRRLFDRFVRQDAEAMDHGGVEVDAEDLRGGVEADAADGEHQALARGGEGDESRGDEGEDDEPVEHRQARVHVGVGGALHRAEGAEEELVAREPGVEGEEREHRGAEAEEVRARPAVRLEAPRPEGEAAPSAVEHRGEEEAHADERRQRRGERLERRQGEDVEGDVLAEDGIGDAEGGGVHPAQPRVPVRRAAQPGEERHHRDDGPDEAGDDAPDLDPGLSRGVGEDHALEPLGELGDEPEVRRQHPAVDEPDGHPEPDARPEDGGEELLVTERAEPAKVDVERRDRRQREQHEQQDHSRQDPLEEARARFAVVSLSHDSALPRRAPAYNARRWRRAFCGAGGGFRTHTWESPTGDFKSPASANSATPAMRLIAGVCASSAGESMGAGPFRARCAEYRPLTPDAFNQYHRVYFGPCFCCRFPPTGCSASRHRAVPPPRDRLKAGRRRSRR